MKNNTEKNWIFQKIQYNDIQFQERTQIEMVQEDKSN